MNKNDPAERAVMDIRRILQLVEGVPRGRQEAAFWRYRPPGVLGEVKALRREMHDLKEALAEQVLENRLLNK